MISEIMPELYYLNHKFKKFKTRIDLNIFNFDCYFTCEKCEITVYLFGDNTNKYYYNSKIHSKIKMKNGLLDLTCEEVTIKKLLE